jgi:predicted transcriptional regulator of viral defense system
MALTAQHGVVTTADLHACGFGPSAIARVAGAGVLRRLHRGVYLLGPVEPPHARAMAALLACVPGAALSHHAAAALWEIRPAPDGPIHVIHPGSARARRGTRPHRMALQERDVTRRSGLRLTRPARTVLDLASCLDERALARALEQAQVMRLVAVTELREVLARAGPRHAALQRCATCSAQRATARR